VGIDQSLGRGLSGRIEGYTRDLTHLRPVYVNASASIRLFPEIEDDRILVAATRGRSRGVEFSLEREAGKRIDWSTSYVLSSSEQQVNGLWIPRISDQPRALHVDWSLHPVSNAQQVNGLWIPRISDQPRALHVDWSLHPVSNAWRLTASGIWHSGWPYTPNVIRIDTIGTTPATMFAHATWLAGPLNSERVPGYQRVDLRWTRFIDTHSGRVSMFLEVYNLLNTRNLRDRFTNVNINRLNVAYYDGNREQLPRIPSF
jgi:hypothetical protein